MATESTRTPQRPPKKRARAVFSPETPMAPLPSPREETRQRLSDVKNISKYIPLSDSDVRFSMQRAPAAWRPYPHQTSKHHSPAFDTQFSQLIDTLENGAGVLIPDEFVVDKKYCTRRDLNTLAQQFKAMDETELSELIQRFLTKHRNDTEEPFLINAKLFAFRLKYQHKIPDIAFLIKFQRVFALTPTSLETLQALITLPTIPLFEPGKDIIQTHIDFLKDLREGKNSLKNIATEFKAQKLKLLTLSEMDINAQLISLKSKIRALKDSKGTGTAIIDSPSSIGAFNERMHSINQQIAALENEREQLIVHENEYRDTQQQINFLKDEYEQEAKILRGRLETQIQLIQEKAAAFVHAFLQPNVFYDLLCQNLDQPAVCDALQVATDQARREDFGFCDYVQITYVQITLDDIDQEPPTPEQLLQAYLGYFIKDNDHYEWPHASIQGAIAQCHPAIKHSRSLRSEFEAAKIGQFGLSTEMQKQRDLERLEKISEIMKTLHSTIREGITAIAENTATSMHTIQSFIQERTEQLDTLISDAQRMTMVNPASLIEKLEGYRTFINEPFNTNMFIQATPEQQSRYYIHHLDTYANGPKAGAIF